MKAVDTFLMYARFMGGLPAHLRSHLTVEQAQEAVRRGLAGRDDNFLRIARRTIYGHTLQPVSADAATGRVRVRRHRGLGPRAWPRADPCALRAEGVYVTFEEYKGRRRIERGDRDGRADDHAFDNPLARRGYEGSTGGSTGRKGNRVGTDLDNLTSQAPHPPDRPLRSRYLRSPDRRVEWGSARLHRHRHLPSRGCRPAITRRSGSRRSPGRPPVPPSGSGSRPATSSGISRLMGRALPAARAAAARPGGGHRPLGGRGGSRARRLRGGRRPSAWQCACAWPRTTPAST